MYTCDGEKYARIGYANKYWSYKSYTNVIINQGSSCQVKHDLFLGLSLEKLLLLIAHREVLGRGFIEACSKDPSFATLRSNAFVRRKSLAIDTNDFNAHRFAFSKFNKEYYKWLPVNRVREYKGKNSVYHVAKRADTSLFNFVQVVMDHSNGPLASLLLAKLLLCLVVMHNKSIVHRDIHADNVLVFFNEKNNLSCKLTDFGLAVQADSIIDEFHDIAKEFFLQLPPEAYVDKNARYTVCFDMWGVAISVLLVLSRGVYQDTTLNTALSDIIKLYIDNEQEHALIQQRLDDLVSNIVDTSASMKKHKSLLHRLLKLDCTQRPADINDLYIRHVVLSLLARSDITVANYLSVFKHIDYFRSVSQTLHRQLVTQLASVLYEDITADAKIDALDGMLEALQSSHKITPEALEVYALAFYKLAMFFRDYSVPWSQFLSVVFYNAHSYQEVHRRVEYIVDQFPAVDLLGLLNNTILNAHTMVAMSPLVVSYAVTRLYLRDCDENNYDMNLFVKKIKGCFSGGEDMAKRMDEIGLWICSYVGVDQAFVIQLTEYLVVEMATENPELLSYYTSSRYVNDLQCNSFRI